MLSSVKNLNKYKFTCFVFAIYSLSPSRECKQTSCTASAPSANTDTERDVHLLNDLGHQLFALVLQARKAEELGRLPDLQNIVLTYSLSQRGSTQALQAWEQIHVGHVQHVQHVVGE